MSFSQCLSSDMLDSQQEILNFNEAVGYMQIADGVLSNISDQTDELNTLSVASNNAALNSDQKSMINSQMQDIVEIAEGKEVIFQYLNQPPKYFDKTQIENQELKKFITDKYIARSVKNIDIELALTK